MRRRNPVLQGGAVLIWVALTLLATASLAFVVNRQAASSAQTVEASIDVSAARYLAEAGVSEAKWRNQQNGCKQNANIAPTSFAGEGSYQAMVSKGPGKKINIVATGTTPSKAQFSLTRNNVIMHKVDQSNDISLGQGKNSTNTYLTLDFPAQTNDTASYLQLTQGRANALLQFSLAGLPADSQVTRATLSLQLYYPGTGSAGAVSVHRLTQAWDAAAANWTMAKSANAWTTPGGDYEAGNRASSVVGAAATYQWDVTSLVDSWSSAALPNAGLLLRADGGLSDARFASFSNSTFATPVIAVTYLPPC